MSGFSNKKVLVVDDEPDIREILKDEFSLEDAQTYEAENGKKAFEIVKSNELDVVISDIRMPGGDGFTLAQNIKSLNCCKPIVFLITGFADLMPYDAYDVGVEGFIHKPFNLEQIRNDILWSLTARQLRWSLSANPDLNSNTKNNVKDFELKENFSAFQEKDVMKVGRGGLFFQGDFVSLKVGDFANIRFQDGEFIVGKAKWIRIEENDSLRTGIGVEFLAISDKLLDVILSYISTNKPTAYIPKN